MIQKYGQIYIAAPFFSPQQIQRLQVVESMCEKFHAPYHSPRNFMVLRPDATSEELQAVFNSNVTNMLKSQLILALTDEPDTGMHWEMGYAYAKNIPVIIVSFTKKPVNVMLVQGCAGFVQDEAHLVEFIKGRYYNDPTSGETYKDYNWEALLTWKNVGRPVF
jgi:nucleoside deoxyribosyltransferase